MKPAFKYIIDKAKQKYAKAKECETSIGNFTKRQQSRKYPSRNLLSKKNQQDLRLIKVIGSPLPLKTHTYENFSHV